jgi:hypothetical protein
LESEINDIIEQDLRSELENYTTFERLNSEKITPYFMKLVKQSCAADSLDSIGYDDTKYTSRDAYITEFYEDLYKKPREHADCTENSIPEFLGNSANSQYVLESKISDREWLALDLDLNIHELDKAINQANKKKRSGYRRY